METDLNLLKCFQVVSKEGSISRASSTLHLSQPAISLQIKKLEEQLGKQLFDRHNRGLILTPFGKAVLDHVRKISHIAIDIQRLAHDDKIEPIGKVSIGTYTTASSYLLAESASLFLSRYPKTSISYEYETVDSILQGVLEHKLDCGIITDVPANSVFSIQPFFRDELVYVISSKRKESKKNKITPKELSSIDFLSYPLRYDRCYRLVEQYYGRHLAKSRITVESTSFDTLKQMLLRGVGGTFMPLYLVRDEIQRGSLVHIEVANQRLPIEFSFVTKKGADLSKAIIEFRKLLFAQFKR